MPIFRSPLVPAVVNDCTQKGQNLKATYVKIRYKYREITRIRMKNIALSLW